MVFNHYLSQVYLSVHWFWKNFSSAAATWWKVGVNRQNSWTVPVSSSDPAINKQLTVNDAFLNTKWRRAPAGASTSLLAGSQAAPLRDPCTWAAGAAAVKQQAAVTVLLRRAIMFRSSKIMDVCSVFGFTERWEINLFSHVIALLPGTDALIWKQTTTRAYVWILIFVFL